MTTEAALRKALAELRDWHKSEHQSNQWIDARVDAALALPETPKEYRVEYEFRWLDVWEGRSSGLIICEAYAVAKAKILADITSRYRNVSLESRTAAGPWTPLEVKA